MNTGRSGAEGSRLIMTAQMTIANFGEDEGGTGKEDEVDEGESILTGRGGVHAPIKEVKHRGEEILQICFWQFAH